MANNEQSAAASGDADRLRQLESLRNAARELAEIERRSREIEISSAFRGRDSSTHITR